jgi:hypothetical protein
MSTPFNIDLFKKVVAPEFEPREDLEIKLFADEAYLELSESVWGKRHPRAWCLITAHMMKLAEKTKADGGDSSTGSVNELKRVKVGDLEREYAVPGKSNTNDADTYGLTLYGKEFLRLRKQVLMTPMFV